MTNKFDAVIVPESLSQPALQDSLRWIREFKHERIDAINANAAQIDATNYRKFKINEFDDDAKDLGKRAKEVTRIISERTGLAAILLEVKVAENDIKAAAKERADKIRAFRDANEPPVPVLNFLYQAQQTSDEYRAIAKALDKQGVQWRSTIVDGSDAAAVDAIFNKNPNTEVK